MEFNWLHFNGLSASCHHAAHRAARSAWRLRFVNFGMDHTDHLMAINSSSPALKGPRSRSTGITNTVSGRPRKPSIEFEAKYPGDWIFTAIFPHHMMNSMMISSATADSNANTTYAKALSQMQLCQPLGVDTSTTPPSRKTPISVPRLPARRLHGMAMDTPKEFRAQDPRLPANWSAGMMGMMTMVRVLPTKIRRNPSLIRNHQAPSRGAPPSS